MMWGKIFSHENFITLLHHSYKSYLLKPQLSFATTNKTSFDSCRNSLAIQQLIYDTAMNLSSKNTAHAWVLPFVRCRPKTGERKVQMDRISSNYLVCLQVIPEKNLESNSQLENQIKQKHLRKQVLGLKSKAFLIISLFCTRPAWKAESLCLKGNWEILAFQDSPTSNNVALGLKERDQIKGKSMHSLHRQQTRTSKSIYIKLQQIKPLKRKGKLQQIEFRIVVAFQYSHPFLTQFLRHIMFVY